MPPLSLVAKTYPTQFLSRKEAFLWQLHDQNGIDDVCVDSLMLDEDIQLLTELVCFILDVQEQQQTQNIHVNTLEISYIVNDHFDNNTFSPDPILPAFATGFRFRTQAIINKLGINQGRIPVNESYYGPLIALYRESSSSIFIRAHLIDFFRILRNRTDWTSESFRNAMASSQFLQYEKNLAQFVNDGVINSSHCFHNALSTRIFELVFFKHTYTDAENDNTHLTEDYLTFSQDPIFNAFDLSATIEEILQWTGLTCPSFYFSDRMFTWGAKSTREHFKTVVSRVLTTFVTVSRLWSYVSFNYRFYRIFIELFVFNKLYEHIPLEIRQVDDLANQLTEKTYLSYIPLVDRYLEDTEGGGEHAIQSGLNPPTFPNQVADLGIWHMTLPLKCLSLFSLSTLYHDSPVHSSLAQHYVLLDNCRSFLEDIKKAKTIIKQHNTHKSNKFKRLSAENPDIRIEFAIDDEIIAQERLKIEFLKKKFKFQSTLAQRAYVLHKWAISVLGLTFTPIGVMKFLYCTARVYNDTDMLIQSEQYGLTQDTFKSYSFSMYAPNAIANMPHLATALYNARYYFHLVEFHQNTPHDFAVEIMGISNAYRVAEEYCRLEQTSFAELVPLRTSFSPFYLSIGMSGNAGIELLQTIIKLKIPMVYSHDSGPVVGRGQQPHVPVWVELWHTYASDDDLVEAFKYCYQIYSHRVVLTSLPPQKSLISYKQLWGMAMGWFSRAKTHHLDGFCRKKSWHWVMSHLVNRAEMASWMRSANPQELYTIFSTANSFFTTDTVRFGSSSAYRVVFEEIYEYLHEITMITMRDLLPTGREIECLIDIATDPIVSLIGWCGCVQFFEYCLDRLFEISPTSSVFLFLRAGLAGLLIRPNWRDCDDIYGIIARYKQSKQTQIPPNIQYEDNDQTDQNQTPPLFTNAPHTDPVFIHVSQKDTFSSYIDLDAHYYSKTQRFLQFFQNVNQTILFPQMIDKFSALLAQKQIQFTEFMNTLSSQLAESYKDDIFATKYPVKDAIAKSYDNLGMFALKSSANASLPSQSELSQCLEALPIWSLHLGKTNRASGDISFATLNTAHTTLITSDLFLQFANQHTLLYTSHPVAEHLYANLSPSESSSINIHSNNVDIASILPTAFTSAYLSQLQHTFSPPTLHPSTQSATVDTVHYRVWDERYHKILFAPQQTPPNNSKNYPSSNPKDTKPTYNLEIIDVLNWYRSVTPIARQSPILAGFSIYLNALQQYDQIHDFVTEFPQPPLETSNINALNLVMDSYITRAIIDELCRGVVRDPTATINPSLAQTSAPIFFSNNLLSLNHHYMPLTVWLSYHHQKHINSRLALLTTDLEHHSRFHDLLLSNDTHQNSPGYHVSATQDTVTYSYTPSSEPLNHVIFDNLYTKLFPLLYSSSMLPSKALPTELQYLEKDSPVVTPPEYVFDPAAIRFLIPVLNEMKFIPPAFIQKCISALADSGQAQSLLDNLLPSSIPHQFTGKPDKIAHCMIEQIVLKYFATTAKREQYKRAKAGEIIGRDVDLIYIPQTSYIHDPYLTLDLLDVYLTQHKKHFYCNNNFYQSFHTDITNSNNKHLNVHQQADIHVMNLLLPYHQLAAIYNYKSFQSKQQNTISNSSEYPIEHVFTNAFSKELPYNPEYAKLWYTYQFTATNYLITHFNNVAQFGMPIKLPQSFYSDERRNTLSSSNYLCLALLSRVYRRQSMIFQQIPFLLANILNYSYELTSDQTSFINWYNTQIRAAQNDSKKVVDSPSGYVNVLLNHFNAQTQKTHERTVSHLKDSIHSIHASNPHIYDPDPNQLIPYYQDALSSSTFVNKVPFVSLYYANPVMSRYDPRYLTGILNLIHYHSKNLNANPGNTFHPPQLTTQHLIRYYYNNYYCDMNLQNTINYHIYSSDTPYFQSYPSFCAEIIDYFAKSVGISSTKFYQNWLKAALLTTSALGVGVLAMSYFTVNSGNDPNMSDIQDHNDEKNKFD